MTLPEITAVTAECLSFSTDEWEDEARVPYPSPTLAEGSERLFYLCPKCGRFSTIHSHGRIAECTSCGFSVEFDEYGRISSSDPSISWTKLSEWHSWEKGKLADILSLSDGARIFSDRGILFQIPGRKKLRTVSEAFDVSASSDRLRFSFDRPFDFDGRSISELEFPLSSIESMIINAKQTIEFYADGKQYRFRTALDRSPLKYQELYLACKAGSEE